MYFKGFYPQNYYNVMFTSNLSILNFFKFSKMKKKEQTQNDFKNKYKEHQTIFSKLNLKNEKSKVC